MREPSGRICVRRLLEVSALMIRSQVSSTLRHGMSAFNLKGLGCLCSLCLLLDRFFQEFKDSTEPVRCPPLQRLGNRRGFNQVVGVFTRHKKEAADATMDFASTLIHELTHTTAGGQTIVCLSSTDVRLSRSIY